MAEILGHELKDWLPENPLEGPPLPGFLNIFWPWYKKPAASFSVSNLVISPNPCNPGQTVTVSCTVTNSGSQAGTHIVQLTGDFTDQKPVTVQPGKSQTVSFQLTPSAEGTYNIALDNLTGTLQVTSEPVADIVLSALTVSPNPCNVGDTVTITVLATNQGAVAGTKTITFSVGDDTYNQDVSLDPVGSKQVSIQITAPTTSVPIPIRVDGIAADLTVTNPNPATGALSGTVTDANTGQPVQGATVTVQGLADQTDTQGHYTILGIQPVPQTFEIGVVCNGYNTLSQNVTITKDGVTQNLSITPIVVTPTQLILSGVNLPGYLWTGYIKDMATGAEQSWGVQNAQEPVILNTVSATQVVLTFRNLDQNYNILGDYVYLVNLPGTAGSFVWDYAAARFQGGSPSTDLLSSNNKQFVKGTVVSSDIANGIITLQVASSDDISGYMNVGKYFIGDTITLYTPVPSGLPSAVECQITFARLGVNVPNGVVYVQGWTVDYIRAQRPFPPSAYQFSASIGVLSTPVALPPQLGGGVHNVTTGFKINSITGNVPNFKVAVVMMSGDQVPYSSRVVYTYTVKWSATGPITAPVTAPVDTNGSGVVLPTFYVLANPDPNAVIDGADPQLSNWIVLSQAGWSS